MIAPPAGCNTSKTKNYKIVIDNEHCKILWSRNHRGFLNIPQDVHKALSLAEDINTM